MNFKKHLTLEDFQILIKSIFPNEKASLLGNILKDGFMISNGNLYEIQSNITYKIVKSEIRMTLLNVSTLLIQESFSKLSSDQQQMMVLELPKDYKMIFTNSSVEKFYPQLFKLLEKSEIKFDDYLCEIHFNNGYMDLNTLEFQQRVLHKNFIIDHISRDYVKSSLKQQTKILKHVQKIYSKQDDLDNILLIIGSCLSGKAQVDQDTLFLLGMGSSGKSFTMELTKAAIECYLQELNDSTFEKNNGKIDKILNTFLASPCIRISWINEIKDTKIDDSLFKTFCDGKVQATQLYKDGTTTISLNSKAIISANTMPNIKIDSGVFRRIL